MKLQLKQLERLVEHEAKLLADLPPVEPRPEVLVRVKAAVRAEAARLGGATPAIWRLPRWTGIAAAVLLAVGLSGPFTGPLRPAEPADGGVESMNLWADAVGDSNDRLSSLLDDGWLLEGGGRDGESVEGLLDNLDASFEQLYSGTM